MTSFSLVNQRISYQFTMNKIVDKFPYKKSLYLQWFEAAIGNLILFKHLKEKFNNNIYFLISDQGILLKATTSNYLKNAQEEITKFYTAKMEMLDTTASSDFYEKILEDIREETDKLKDSRDCPYINLAYSEKLKHSCLALKKFGYGKPYETWEITQREKRGFCYLIVRPQHRWKEIANNVMALIKKRENLSHKNEVECNWPVEMSYQHFIWLYLRKEFSNFKKDLEIKEKKGEAAVVVTFKKNITEFIDLEKIINILQCSYSEERPVWKDRDEPTGNKKTCKPVFLSTLELEKVTELIYHEYGLPNLVRQIRGKNQKYLTICPSEELNIQSFTEESSLASNLLINYKSKLFLQEDIGRIQEGQIHEVLRLGKRHKIINYAGKNCIMAKYDLPLNPNIENVLKCRLPSLPRYLYAYQKKQQLCLIRHYELVILKNALQTESLTNQIYLINSTILIIQDLHKRDIFVGSGFMNNLFVDKLRIIVQPSEAGSKKEDDSKLILLVREWVKNMKECDIKTELQKINDPLQMLPLFDDYLSENFI